MWSRQTYRLGPQDFTANLEEGVGVDWRFAMKILSRGMKR